MSLYSMGHVGLSLIQALVFMVGLMRRKTLVTSVSLLLVASSVYDNALIGFGSTIGAGESLTILSYVRFYTHWAFVPFLLLPAAVFVAPRRNQWLVPATGVVAAVLSVVEVKEGFFTEKGLILAPLEFYGMLRMVSASEVKIPIITIAVNVVLLIVGALMRSQSSLLRGSLAALIGNAIPSSMVGPLPGTIGEALLYASILKTETSLLTIRRDD